MSSSADEVERLRRGVHTSGIRNEPDRTETAPTRGRVRHSNGSAQVYDVLKRENLGHNRDSTLSGQEMMNQVRREMLH
jgi:hypothetical protein